MKVQNEMATKITLDTIEAANSLKSFTSGISALTNGWKASEAAHKAVGDSLGALKAKFDGIGNVIEVQKQKIEELKSRQEGLDRTNKSQAETWLKLEKDIQTATRQLTSYEAQQEKAKSSMEYYTSGLADLQKGYRNTQALSKSYAERLQAEGKALDAKKVQLSGVKNSLTNLSKQYQLQEKELQSIAEKSGITSEAYMKQQIRLNETATAMAKAKSSIGQLNAEMKVLNPGVFTRMKNKANELNGRMGKLKESVLSFKGLVGVNLISNAVTSGFTLLTSQMKGIISTGIQISKTAGAMKKRWENLGASANDIKQLTNTLSDLKTNSNLTAEAVNKMQTNFYGITGSVEKTNTLSKGVASLSLQLKLSQDQANNFATGLGKIEASGKVTRSSLQKLEKQAPGLTTALQKASGKSKEAFDTLLDSGKMTSDQFNDILEKASEDYKKNSKAFGETSGGALKKMQENWKSTQAKLAEPLVKVQATGLNELNKALDDKETQKGIQQIGKYIAQVAVQSAKFLAYLAKHQSTVKSFVKVIGSMVILVKVTGWIKQFVAAAASVAGALGPWGLAITGITLALTYLYTHSDKFKKFVNGLVKAAKEAFNNIVKFFKNLPKEISKVWKNVTGFFSKDWKSIKDTTNKGIKNTQKSWNKFNKDVAKFANNMWKDTKKKFSDGWNSLKKNADNGKDKVVKSWNNLNNATLNVAKKMAKENPKQFKSGYDAIQSYTNTWKDFTSGHWNKLGGDINDTAKNIRKFTKDIFKDMYDWLNEKTGGRLGDMVKAFQDKFGSLKDIVASAIKGVKHKTADLVNGVINPINDMLSGLKNGINWVLEKVGAPKITASWKIPTVSYAKGTPNMQGVNGTHQGGLALVNDGVGEHYREMFRLPDGKVGIFPKQRNMVVPLPKGSSVLNGEDTYKLTTMLGIPAYANGIGKFFKGVWNSAVDLVDEAEDILKKPAEFLKEVFEKHIGNLSAKGLAGDIITNFPNKLASLAVGWVKKLFEDFGAGGDGNSPAGRMAKSEFSKIAKHAARLMHQKLSERDIEHLYYQASTESSVDPAQNGGYDDHDGTGLPIGLFQYKLGTWRSWAVPGHANIHSALDQIMAVLNDSNWRNDFPPIGVKRGWGPSGHRMMAYGGRIDTNQLIEVAENNKPEYIIPTDPAKRPRAWQLMHELTSEFTNQEPQRINVSDNRDLKELNDKFDSLLAMFSQLLGLNNQQIKAIRESGFDKIKQYQQQALDQRLADYQGY